MVSPDEARFMPLGGCESSGDVGFWSEPTAERSTVLLTKRIKSYYLFPSCFFAALASGIAAEKDRRQAT
jgi:hypothetical protein